MITEIIVLFVAVVVMLTIIQILIGKEEELSDSHCPHCKHYTLHIPTVEGRMMECENCHKYSIAVWRNDNYGHIKIVWRKIHR